MRGTRKIKSVEYLQSCLLDLNEHHAIIASIPADKKARLRKHLSALSPESIDVPAELVRLVGPSGESAMVEKGKPESDIVMRFGLALSIRDQFRWVNTASQFFKPRITRSDPLHDAKGCLRPELTPPPFSRKVSGTEWEDNQDEKPFVLRYRTHETAHSGLFGGKDQHREKRKMIGRAAWQFLRKKLANCPDKKAALSWLEKHYSAEAERREYRNGWRILQGQRLLIAARTANYNKLP